MTNDEYFELNFLREWFSTPRAMTKLNQARLKEIERISNKGAGFMKYTYNGISLKKYCDKSGISYQKVLKKIKKDNVSIEKAIKTIHKKAGKMVIDIENLELWDSLTICAKQLNVSVQSVFCAIINGNKVRGHRVEYFDLWINWDNRDKEKHTSKNNIYFL